jgi:hypothetical protein
MSLPSTTPVWSIVEMKKFHLSSRLFVATVPTALSHDATPVERLLTAETSRRVRELCDRSVANSLNQLTPEKRAHLTGRKSLIRRQEAHRSGYGVVEVTPYVWEDDEREYLRLTLYICHRKQIVSNGDEIDPVEVRRELGYIVDTTTHRLVN